MRAVKDVVHEGRHLKAQVQIKDLEMFDILDTGSIVTSVTPVPRGIHVTIRQQCSGGTAIVDTLLWQPDNWVTILYKY